MNNISFENYIKEKRPLIKSKIEEFLSAKKNEVVKQPYFIDVLDKITPFTTQGKLIRGILVLLSYEMNNKQLDNRLLNASAAIELVQSAFLIHDDIIDQDLTRRGGKSIYAQYSEEMQGKQTPEKNFYGLSMGMCAGDLVFFLAYELLGNSNSNVTIQQQLIHLFSKEFQTVASAQMMDFANGQKQLEQTKEQILQIYTLKTARYSFSLPLQMGAIAAGADGNTIKTLGAIGEKIGIMFQIKDDELGLIADEADLGKPIGSDIRENKKTLIRLLLYQHLNSIEKNIVDRLFGNKELTKNDIDVIKSTIEKYQVLDEIQKEIDLLKNEAAPLIESLPFDNNAKNMISQIVDFTTNRTK